MVEEKFIAARRPELTTFLEKDTDFGCGPVVIVGQDPYHGVGQANGLSFSVNKWMTLPPSLKNIFQEI